MFVPELRRLRILRELAERGTMAAVADSLGYSPSAISQQLAVLEREVGVDLIEQAGRGIRLTEAGRLLADGAADLLDRADLLGARLDAIGGRVQGQVRAVGLQSATRRLLIPAMTEVAHTHPELRVDLTELELEDALPELRLGAVDLLISDEYDGHPRPRPKGVQHELVLQERTRLVLPADHPMAAEPRVTLSALRDEVWTSSLVGTGHHAMVVGTCRAIGGFDPDLRHCSNDADVQLELVRRGHAVTLLPDLTLPVGDPSLVLRDVQETNLTRKLYLVTRQGVRSAPLQTFADALQRVSDGLGAKPDSSRLTAT